MLHVQVLAGLQVGDEPLIDSRTSYTRSFGQCFQQLLPVYSAVADNAVSLRFSGHRRMSERRSRLPADA